jgi:hypothetical protein
MRKNLEEKIDFDICNNYCEKHRCDNCYYANIVCPFLEVKTLLKEMSKTVIINNL